MADILKDIQVLRDRLDTVEEIDLDEKGGDTVAGRYAQDRR